MELTPQATFTIIAAAMPRLWRSVVALAAVPAFMCASVVAPSHVHEADADDQSVMHRHFAPHHEAESQIDHESGHVVWADDAAVPSVTQHFVVVLQVPETVQEPPDVPARWFAIISNDAAPPHGPPRVVSLLRGPPRLSL